MAQSRPHQTANLVAFTKFPNYGNLQYLNAPKYLLMIGTFGISLVCKTRVIKISIGIGIKNIRVERFYFATIQYGSLRGWISNIEFKVFYFFF